MSVSASFDAVKLRITYSIAALRLKASIRAVCFSATEFPTDRTSMPSVVEPTDSSGCSAVRNACVGRVCVCVCVCVYVCTCARARNFVYIFAWESVRVRVCARLGLCVIACL